MKFVDQYNTCNLSYILCFNEEWTVELSPTLDKWLITG